MIRKETNRRSHIMEKELEKGTLVLDNGDEFGTLRSQMM